MGILDDLKHQVEKLGDKAKEGLEGAKDKAGDLLDDAKDKAGDLIDDAKERFGDDDSAPLTESSDVGPDSSSTDAEQPGYVTGEDDVDDLESSDGTLDDETETEADDVVTPAAAELDPVDLDAVETDDADAAEVEAAVETDVDPYDDPLSEPIGDEIAGALVDAEAVAESVDETSSEKDAQA